VSQLVHAYLKTGFLKAKPQMGQGDRGEVTDRESAQRIRKMQQEWEIAKQSLGLSCRLASHSDSEEALAPSS
jgi:hypothetical protein